MRPHGYGNAIINALRRLAPLPARAQVKTVADRVAIARIKVLCRQCLVDAAVLLPDDVLTRLEAKGVLLPEDILALLASWNV
jgi:hypothetical protein